MTSSRFIKYWSQPQKSETSNAMFQCFTVAKSFLKMAAELISSAVRNMKKRIFLDNNRKTFIDVILACHARNSIGLCYQQRICPLVPTTQTIKTLTAGQLYEKFDCYMWNTHPPKPNTGTFSIYIQSISNMIICK